MSKKIIDLTFPIHEGMTTFPMYWHPFVEVTQLGRHGIENRETRKLVLGTHTGTHMDAPLHFIPGGLSVDLIPLDRLVGPAKILDFSKARLKQKLEVADFKKSLGQKKYERLIMRFDWSKNWGKSCYYTDHPFISEEASRWLVETGVKVLGMDTPMPDDPLNGRGTCNDSPNHKILLGGGTLLVEYLCNLHLIKKPIFDWIVLPLKIKGGDGSPVRSVAIFS